jgi:hypothetical protein
MLLILTDILGTSSVFAVHLGILKEIEKQKTPRSPIFLPLVP